MVRSNKNNAYGSMDITAHKDTYAEQREYIDLIDSANIHGKTKDINTLIHSC